MELFLPGFAALLIAALIVFLVLPRLGAPILAGLSLALLAYGVYNHAQLFGYEYRYSTWQDAFKSYGSFVMIGFLILAILFYIAFLFMTKGPSALPASNLPANSAVVNAVNNASNIVGDATEAVTNVLNNVSNTILGNGNGRNNRSTALSNLTNILATPAAAFNNRGNNKNKNNFF